MCAECASAALAAEEFRLFVHKAQTIWSRAVQNLKQLSEETSDDATSVCAFMSQKDSKFNIVKDSGSGSPLEVVNRSKAKIKARQRRKPIMYRNGPMTTCPDCHRCFANPHLLHQHLQNSDRKDVCLICGIVVPKGATLQKHMQDAHNETTFLCCYCPLAFFSEDELKEHDKKAHKSGAMSCNACGKTFTRLSSYESHAEMHKVMTCRKCGVQFNNRGCFRQHRSICEPTAKRDPKTIPRVRRSNNRDPGQYICDYCEKCYTCRQQLQNHILWIHLNHRPHQCSWCGKRFYTTTRLNEHTVVHTRVRKFECDICGLKLVSKTAALYHKRRHTGEKPYVCGDCGAAFITASRRLEHEKRKHNKGVRFQCVSCSSSFVRRRELEKHVERHHKEVPDPKPEVLTVSFSYA